MNTSTTADTVLGQRLGVVVAESRQVASDVVLLRLVDPAGSPLPPWSAGAHIDVILPSGLIRQYSLCGDPDDRHSYSIAVLREVNGRGGSKEIHDTVGVGCKLSVTAPRNHFELVPALEYVLVAGGIGITPLLTMCRELCRTGTPWHLYYGGRTRTTMAFVDELLALDPGRVHLVTEDETGLLDLPTIVGGVGPGTEIYCCGPEGLLTALEKTVATQLPGHKLRSERFGAGSLPDPTDSAVDTAFEVELHRSNITITVAADQTILDAVTRVVPTVVSSCEEGFCGTCETRVLGGVPLHRDVILSDEERERGDRMFICVGRARSSRLVLDL